MLGIYSDCLKVLEKQVVYFQALKQSGAGAAARRSNLRSGLGSMFFWRVPETQTPNRRFRGHHGVPDQEATFLALTSQ